MKKVVYSVYRTGKSDSKISGIGYVTEKDLITACIGQNGKPYIRVFEDCIDDCNAVGEEQIEFKGLFKELKEIRVEVKNSFGESKGYDTKDIELHYNIWFKYVNE